MLFGNILILISFLYYLIFYNWVPFTLCYDINPFKIFKIDNRNIVRISTFYMVMCLHYTSNDPGNMWLFDKNSMLMHFWQTATNYVMITFFTLLNGVDISNIEKKSTSSLHSVAINVLWKLTLTTYSYHRFRRWISVCLVQTLKNR